MKWPYTSSIPVACLLAQEAYRVLAPGGEMYFSDVYCDRRLPADIRTDPVLLGECLGGALYKEDFRRLCQAVGFTDPRQLSAQPIEVGKHVRYAIKHSIWCCPVSTIY